MKGWWGGGRQGTASGLLQQRSERNEVGRRRRPKRGWFRFLRLNSLRLLDKTHEEY